MRPILLILWTAFQSFILRDNNNNNNNIIIIINNIIIIWSIDKIHIESYKRHKNLN